MTTSHSQQTVEAEGESLEEARNQIKSQIPQGLSIISEKIISNGKPKSAKGIAETIDESFAKAQNEVPNGADVVEKKVLVSPDRKVVTVEAFDEHNARVQAENQSGRTRIIRAIKLVASGSKGIFGIGKKLNQYEVEVFQEAAVEIIYKTKAKISVTIGKPILDNLCVIFGPGYQEFYEEFAKKLAAGGAPSLTIKGLSDTDLDILEIIPPNMVVIVIGRCVNDLYLPEIETKSIQLTFVHNIPKLKYATEQDHKQWASELWLVSDQFNKPKSNYTCAGEKAYACLSLEFPGNNTRICFDVAKALEDMYIKHGGSID